jgi:enoyl-CoA hydratase/carnithine racemase
MGDEVLAEIRGQVGCITLNRAKALNALSLGMVRALTELLLLWQGDPAVAAVAIRGTSKTGPFGGFCAGGDIRFFHQAAHAGNPELEDFFTEEYRLNHLIHNYTKPYIAFMDGIVMGGGMGISQGASHRLVTGRTKMAMPETHIGLFPDVGGGYFLSRCPGHTGEWLALTGETLGASTAIELGLADICLDSEQLDIAWQALAGLDFAQPAPLDTWVAMFSIAACADSMRLRGTIDHYFSLGSVVDIVSALESGPTEWAKHTAAVLRKRSPLMLHVVLEQVVCQRHLACAADLLQHHMQHQR